MALSFGGKKYRAKHHFPLQTELFLPILAVTGNLGAYILLEEGRFLPFFHPLCTFEDIWPFQSSNSFTKIAKIQRGCLELWYGLEIRQRIRAQEL